MAFVAVSLSVGTAVGLGTGTAAILGGGALIGAGVGGLYSAITGDGDILNSMLTGGLLGGAGAYGIGAMGGGGAGVQGAMAGPFFGGAAPVSTAVVPTANVATVTPAMEAASLLDAAAVAEGSTTAGMATEYAAQEAAKTAAADLAKKEAAKSGMKTLGYGLAGTSAMQLLGGKGKGAQAPASATDPGMIRPFEYSSTPNEPTGIYPSPYATAEYNEAGNPIMDTRERNYFNQNFAAMQPYSAKIGTVNPNVPLPSSSPLNAANGGIMRNYDDEMGKDDTSLDQGNLQKGLFGLGYAMGGNVMGNGLGGYSDGGRLLRGPGDGVSDDIPATIAGKQPARLADGEFVIPARIVSELGNGSTDAGAKRLYAMMDRIQNGRKKSIGKKNVAKDTKAKKHLPA
jgi:hypothetical protein